MRDAAFIAAMRLLPKNTLSRLVGAAARLRAPQPVHVAAMRAFAAKYRVNLEECAELETFQNFGAFFARPLRSGVRSIVPGDRVPVSPVDGAISEIGTADAGRLVQAKGLDYSVVQLLDDEALAASFTGGAFATIYLSPRDYHRIHFPLGGHITGYRYVPGLLWPVNPASVRNVPNLFCVNERLVTLTDTPLGKCAIVAVGATIVGRIRAFYDASIQPTNLLGATAKQREYETPIPIAKGSELGAFEIGSTVILLFEKGRVALSPELRPEISVRMGQAIGSAAA